MWFGLSRIKTKMSLYYKSKHCVRLKKKKMGEKSKVQRVPLCQISSLFFLLKSNIFSMVLFPFCFPHFFVLLNAQYLMLFMLQWLPFATVFRVVRDLQDFYILARDHVFLNKTKKQLWARGSPVTQNIIYCYYF